MFIVRHLHNNIYYLVEDEFIEIFIHVIDDMYLVSRIGRYNYVRVLISALKFKEMAYLDRSSTTWYYHIIAPRNIAIDYYFVYDHGNVYLEELIDADVVELMLV